MRSEYKRDLNHNYLVLHGEDEIDTSAYQVRMLVGNVIPSLLKCRIQGMDGKFAIYYDITSRQSVAAFYENKKFGEEDLKLIFGGFIRVMEDAAEYLINPGQLVLMPEYMFLELEKRKIYFCFMPGYQKEVKEQFQGLTEYILPKIDHENEKAVVLGYGVYRRALEDCFHLEHIKEELYRTRESESDHKKERSVEIGQRAGLEQVFDAAVRREEDLFSDSEEEFFGKREECPGNEGFAKIRKNKEKGKSRIWKKAAGISAGICMLTGILIIKTLGYLPELGAETILGAALLSMGAGILICTIMKKAKKKKEQKEGRDSEQILRRERAKEEREMLKKQLQKDWKIDRDAEYEEVKFRGKEEVSQQEPNWNLGAEERVPAQFFSGKADTKDAVVNCGETVVLSMKAGDVKASFVSREPGELAAIYLDKELTVIGKLKNASDAVIDLPTVSRIHAKVRKEENEYYLTDLNSRNGTTVNGRLLRADEEYCLQNEDEVDFAQARYVFLK